MSLRKILGRLLLLTVMELGSLAGVPMTQEQIEKLMRAMHATTVEQVVKKEDAGGE
jgi:hypothetical protein